MKPYYYVYRHGNEGPRVRHATLQQAQAEAEMLAEKHPGLSFEILQCVGFASTSKASTFWADGCEPRAEPDDNGWIPFNGENFPHPDAKVIVRKPGLTMAWPVVAKYIDWKDVTYFKHQ